MKRHTLNPHRIITLKLIDYLILYSINQSKEITLSDLKDNLDQNFFPKERDYVKKRIDLLHKKAHYICTTFYSRHIQQEKSSCIEYYILTPEGKQTLYEFSKIINALPIAYKE